MADTLLPPPVSAAPPTLQTEVEESGRPPSRHVTEPHCEDWEYCLLWWGVWNRHSHREAGVPVQFQGRQVVATSCLHDRGRMGGKSSCVVMSYLIVAITIGIIMTIFLTTGASRGSVHTLHRYFVGPLFKI